MIENFRNLLRYFFNYDSWFNNTPNINVRTSSFIIHNQSTFVLLVDTCLVPPTPISTPIRKEGRIESFQMYRNNELSYSYVPFTPVQVRTSKTFDIHSLHMGDYIFHRFVSFQSYLLMNRLIFYSTQFIMSILLRLLFYFLLYRVLCHHLIVDSYDYK